MLPFTSVPTRSAENSNELTGAPTIITDRYHIAERACLLLGNVIEDVNQTIRSTTTREDDYSFAGAGSWTG